MSPPIVQPPRVKRAAGAVQSAAQSACRGCSRSPCRHPMDIAAQIDWQVSDAPVPYPEALAAMEARAAAIRAGTARELVWLLEHPPLFTAGTSADPAEIINPLGLPVFKAGRGGRFTYHGPGQRIAYVLLDLESR